MSLNDNLDSHADFSGGGPDFGGGLNANECNDDLLPAEAAMYYDFYKKFEIAELDRIVTDVKSSESQRLAAAKRLYEKKVNNGWKEENEPLLP